MKKSVFVIIVLLLLIVPITYAYITYSPCSDSDGGKNYEVKGTVTDSSWGRTESDVCTSSTILKEYYCDINVIAFESKTCSNGCSNGACLSPASCSDTDGGKDYYTKGTVSGKKDDGSSFSITDKCNVNRIWEYYCDMSRSANYFMDEKFCDGGCSNDACLHCEPGSTLGCYSGPSGRRNGTRNVGVCKMGTKTCQNDGSWSSCIGEVLPSSEVCDNKDNDCDGVKDEGLSRTQTCGVGECINSIAQTCSAGSWSPLCAPKLKLEVTETTCNDNKDNDCDGQIDCDDTNCGTDVNCVIGVVCTPTTEDCADKIDNDCDDYIDCKDTDCADDENCVIDCSKFTDWIECRDHIECYWYSSQLGYSCESCLDFPPSCSSFGTADDCKPPLPGYSCGLQCVWDGSSCTNPPCLINSDQDSYCDDVDKCKYIKNIDQSDCDGDGIGDVCDPGCDDCDPNPCPICTSINEDGECDDIQDSLEKCDELHGTICSSGLNCIGGYMISSKDSNKCCLIGSCGAISVLLTGQTQYRIEESECKNPNDEGIGKKLVYKYNQNGQLAEPPYEEDCTILPSETVPFYSLISIIITMLVLISFYVFRSNILAYFHK